VAAATRFVAVSLILILAGCSSDDDPGSSDATISATEQLTLAPTVDLPGSATPIDLGTVDPTLSLPATTMAVPETGVPGLDSDDSFCGAWSRFGGSWQVLVQAGSAIDPTEVARLEIVASALVGDAYEAVFAAWPAELDSERDVVAEAYFGAFRRRSDDAAAALAAAGASEDDVSRLASAWAEALAQYDPTQPSVAVVVPDDLSTLVDTAASTFRQQRVPLNEDPTMVITASTPLTDEYLSTACPDQGWIVGQDVIEG
jgi:hypothetical protein